MISACRLVGPPILMRRSSDPRHNDKNSSVQYLIFRQTFKQVIHLRFVNSSSEAPRSVQAKYALQKLRFHDLRACKHVVNATGFVAPRRTVQATRVAAEVGVPAEQGDTIGRMRNLLPPR